MADLIDRESDFVWKLCKEIGLKKMKEIRILIMLILALASFSCDKDSNPISTQDSTPSFVVDSLNVTANPDSVHSKLVYHFQGISGYLTSFTLEVYYSGNTEAYGIPSRGLPIIDTAGIHYTKYKSFGLYYTPAIGFTTYCKCTISGRGDVRNFV